MSDQPPPGYAGPPPTGYGPPSQPGDPYAGGPYPGGPYPDNRAPGWGYPPPYPTGYGAPMVAAYPGYAPIPPGERRPGTLTASAVLGYVNAGFLILMSVVLFSTNSIIDNLNRYDYYDHSNLSTEFAIDAFLNLIAAGLLIAGAISMTNRTALGRLLYSVGAVLVLAESVYWLARWARKDGGSYLTPYPLMFIAVAVVGLSLAWVGGATAWFNRAAARTS